MQPVAAADDDWSVDTSDAAVQARMGNLTSGVKGLALTDDSEKPQEVRFKLFYVFVKVSVLKMIMLIFGFLMTFVSGHALQLMVQYLILCLRSDFILSFKLPFFKGKVLYLQNCAI